MIVVGSYQQVIGRMPALGGGLEGRSHGIQQLVELSIAHRAIQVRARRDCDYNDRCALCAHRNLIQIIDVPLRARIVSF
jgi:hypothetical protein